MIEGYGIVVSTPSSALAYGSAYSPMRQVLLLNIMAFGVAVIASICTARKLTQLIEEVARATLEISAGDFDAKIEISTRDKTSTLNRAIESMVPN